jgi:hypothetical protein
VIKAGEIRLIETDDKSCRRRGTQKKKAMMKAGEEYSRGGA